MADNNSIDVLSLEINANANKADAAISRLATSLEKLQTALGGVSLGQFNNLSAGIRNLANAMERASGAIKTADFTRIASGLNKLASVDVQGVSNASGAINTLVSNLSKIGTISFDSQGIANIANSIATLGRKTVTQAVSNIPLLTTSLQNLITSLNGLRTITFDVTGLNSLVSAITKMGGKAAGIAASKNIDSLADALKRMMATLSTAPRVSQNIIDMTNALAKLASTGGRAGTAANSLTRSFNLFPSSTKKAKKSVFSLASAFGKFYATYFLLIRAIGTLKQAVDISSDLTEVQNVVDVTFGSMSGKIEEFAQSSLKMYGMSELMAKQISGRFQAMGMAMGFSQSKMSDMSVELTKLTADMSSFYNVAQEDVAKALQTVFTGETEPLRKYGLDLSQATLQQWALNNGMDVTVSKMTQMQKTMLRYQYVLANTGAVQGDFSANYYTWANQIRILTGSFQALGSVVGAVIVNALKPFVVAMNQIMISVIGFAETVSNALGAIFGWTYESGGGIATDLELGASAADDLEDATGGAAKNAKELNKYIAGWQEVNNMTSSEDTSGSGRGGAVTDLTQVGSNGEWMRTDKIVEGYISGIKQLETLGQYISNSLTTAMKSIDWNSVYNSAKNFGTGLANFLNGLISPQLFGETGKTIAGALNTVFYGLNSYGQTFDWTEFGQSIATGINNFFATFNFAGMAETLNTWASGLFYSFKTAIANIDWWGVMTGLNNFFKNVDISTIGIVLGAITLKSIGGIIFGGGILKKLGEMAANSISVSIASALAPALGLQLSSGAGIGTVMVELGKRAGNTFMAGFKSLLGSSAATSALTFINTIIKSISGIGTAIAGIAITVSNFFMMWQNGFSWFNEALMIAGVTITGIGSVILGVPATIAAVVAGIVGVVGTLAIVIKDNFGSISEFFVGIGNSISEMWNSAGDILENAIIAVSDFASSVSNKVGEAIEVISEWFKNLPNNIAYDLGSAVKHIVNWGNDVYDFLTKKVPEVIDDVVEWFKGMPDRIYNGIKSFVSIVSSWSTEVYNSLKNGVMATISGVVQWFSELPGKVYNEIIKIQGKITEWKNNTISFFSKEVPQIVSSVIGFFGELPNKIVAVGEDIITGLWNGIQNKVSWIWDEVSGFCSGIISEFKRGFDEHSPSKKAYEIGDYFTLGLSNGLTERFRDVYTEVKDFSRDLTSIPFDFPTVDIGVNMDNYNYEPIKVNSQALSGNIHESIDYALASGLIDYERLGDAMYRAQTQAMKENPLKVGDKEVFSAAQRQQRREYRQTFKTGWAGID